MPPAKITRKARNLRKARESKPGKRMSLVVSPGKYVTAASAKEMSHVSQSRLVGLEFSSECPKTTSSHRLVRQVLRVTLTSNNVHQMKN